MTDPERETVRAYVNSAATMTKCRQDHFKQLCTTCSKYHKACPIYGKHFDNWILLQGLVK